MRNARRILAAASMAASACVLAQAPKLDAVVQDRIAQSETPACVAAGHVGEARSTAFACSPEAGAVRIDAGSLFEIGSIAKGLTGLLLADMVVRGEVGLDDPAAKHSRPGAKLPTRGGREITLRDLVTHTAGLPRLPPGFRPKNMLDPYADFDADALYEALAKTELTREIGLTSEYSNFGFMWLSEMLVRRSGKPYGALLTERVLQPLGMESTHVVVPPALQARVVTGHNSAYQPVPAWTGAPELAGVGDVSSSLDDMLRLGEALSGRRKTALEPAIELALRPLHRMGDPARHVGYGWFMNDTFGNRVYWHNGGTGGFRSAIAFSREKKEAAVVLVDSQAGFDDLAMHLVEPGFPLMRKRVAMPLDADLARQYAGGYELRPGFVITVWEEGGRLMSRATGQSTIELFRESADTFFPRVVDARLVFTRDKDGKVDGLVLHQGGRQVPGKRLPGS